MSYKGDKIVLARESRGLTQKELAEELNIAQGTISKIELGILPCSEEIMNSISSGLGYPKSFFETEDVIKSEVASHYRKLKNVPKKAVMKSKAVMNIVRIHLERFVKSIDLPDIQLVDWDVEFDGNPKLAARELRQQWNIPNGPIANLSRWIEGKGIPIMQFDFDDNIDGISVLANNQIPIIFAKEGVPVDRYRATVAHELGHLVMHFNKKIGEERDIEKEAWLFAGEFLLPSDEISKISERITLESLARLKRYWKVSMSMILMKLQEEKILSYNQGRYLWSQMASNGYKVKEPVQLDTLVDKPQLFELIFDSYQNDLSFSKKEMTDFLNMHYTELQRYYKPNEGRLRVL